MKHLSPSFDFTHYLDYPVNKPFPPTSGFLNFLIFFLNFIHDLLSFFLLCASICHPTVPILISVLPQDIFLLISYSKNFFSIPSSCLKQIHTISSLLHKSYNVFTFKFYKPLPFLMYSLWFSTLLFKNSI